MSHNLPFLIKLFYFIWPFPFAVSFFPMLMLCQILLVVTPFPIPHLFLSAIAFATLKILPVAQNLRWSRRTTQWAEPLWRTGRRWQSRGMVRAANSKSCRALARPTGFQATETLWCWAAETLWNWAVETANGIGSLDDHVFFRGLHRTL